MGVCFVMGECCVCGNLVTFNPNKVPSIRVKGVRQPVCKNCIARANEIRKSRGQEPFVIHPDAYEAMDENELSDFGKGECYD